MRRETTTVVYACDICGEKMEYPLTHISVIADNTLGVKYKTVNFTMCALSPYMTECGDVCQTCVVTAMKKYVNSQENKHE